MIFNESDFKKLGFRSKSGEKNCIEASAEIINGQYITVKLAVNLGRISFLGIEVQGREADKKRKEYLKKYSLDEIYKLFTDF